MSARATSILLVACTISSVTLIALLAASGAFASDAEVTTPDGLKLVEGDWRPKHVDDPLAQEIFDQMVLVEGVFNANEANRQILPFMRAHADFFRGKTMMEIGVGSGINSLYAARLGAKKVVSTDIDPNAAACARMNAERVGVDAVIDVRLVDPDNMGAFAVIGEDEKFDIIFSNPPYALDLDFDKNDFQTDTGDLGLSIVRGLDQHLAPGGVAILYYRTLYYHQVMVKYARYKGFKVTHHNSNILVRWEADTLFNYYTRRLMEREGEKPDAVVFDWKKSSMGRIHIKNPPSKPLLPGSSTHHPGFMIIERTE